MMTSSLDIVYSDVQLLFPGWIWFNQMDKYYLEVELRLLICANMTCIPIILHLDVQMLPEGFTYFSQTCNFYLKVGHSQFRSATYSFCLDKVHADV